MLKIIKSISNLHLLTILLFLAACQPKNTATEAKDIRVTDTIEVCHTFSIDSAALSIQQVLSAQLEGWNKGSVDSFMMGYWNSESLKFITKNGIKFGYQTVSDNYKKSYPNKEAMGELMFDNLAFTSLTDRNDIINVTGKWHVKHHGEMSEGLFSLIFKYTDNDWKIIIDHTW